MSTKNMDVLEVVAKAFKDFCNEVVFVGGAITALYIDDLGAAEPRPTDDVDCVVEISSRFEYQELEMKLMKLGFKHDTTPGAPVCRWKLQNLTVDVMPTDERILGFSNRWYADGIANRISVELPSNRQISIFSIEYFIASKVEAFKGRGNDDLRTSHDFEDIIYVLAGRKSAESDLGVLTGQIATYLKQWAKDLLKRSNLDEALNAHIERGSQGQIGRIKSILKRLAQ